MDCGRFMLCHYLSNGHFVSAINLQRSHYKVNKVYSLNGKDVSLFGVHLSAAVNFS